MRNMPSKRIKKIPISVLVLVCRLLSNKKEKNGCCLIFTALCFYCSLLVKVVGTSLEHHCTIRSCLN